MAEKILATMSWHGRTFQADLQQPIDISLPLVPGATGPNCFWAPLFDASPVRTESFVGDTREGGAVNFYNVALNPHGNGTHTECVGHIARERIAIHDCLQQFHLMGRLVSLYPIQQANGDRMITLNQLRDALEGDLPEAVILRTLPNPIDKRERVWSGSNPPYLETDALSWLADQGVMHLLLDLPSVDREEDGGALAGHHRWWRYPEAPRLNATITEMIYVPDDVTDGWYLVNLQIASFVLDVSPSKPVLFPLSSV